MRIFLDETALRLHTMASDSIQQDLEDLLEIVAATSKFADEQIARIDTIEDQELLPGLTLMDFLYRPNSDAKLVDVRKRLMIALNRMRIWEEEGTPDAFEVEIDGKRIESPTLVWASQLRQAGQAVGCIGLPAGGRSGPLPVKTSKSTETLYFITSLKHRIDFLRDVIVFRRVSPVEFENWAERAFPDLQWVDTAKNDLRTNKACFFGARLPVTVKHLSVLNDHCAEIFRTQVEQSDRISHLASRGVDASPESGKTKKDKSAVRDHTRTWNKQEVQFWWHTKITPYDGGRIHFLYEPPSIAATTTKEAPPANEYPHGRIVIGICVDHLTV
jgi:hypothetical protein